MSKSKQVFNELKNKTNQTFWRVYFQVEKDDLSLLKCSIVCHRKVWNTRKACSMQRNLSSLLFAPTFLFFTFSSLPLEIILKQFSSRLLWCAERVESLWNTVKPVFTGYPWDYKFVAVVDRWSFFRGSFIENGTLNW